MRSVAAGSNPRPAYSLGTANATLRRRPNEYKYWGIRRPLLYLLGMAAKSCRVRCPQRNASSARRRLFAKDSETRQRGICLTSISLWEFELSDATHEAGQTAGSRSRYGGDLISGRR